MKKINKKNGFTLIELIVVVTIIAVITVVGLISYTGMSKKSRDSRKMADLEKIRISLELYRQGTGSTYPETLDQLVTAGYMQVKPVDPNGENYTYTKLSGYTYTVETSVEDAGSSNAPGVYRVTNP